MEPTPIEDRNVTLHLLMISHFLRTMEITVNFMLDKIHMNTLTCGWRRKMSHQWRAFRNEVNKGRQNMVTREQMKAQLT